MPKKECFEELLATSVKISRFLELSEEINNKYLLCMSFLKLSIQNLSEKEMVDYKTSILMEASYELLQLKKQIKIIIKDINIASPTKYLNFKQNEKIIFQSYILAFRENVKSLKELGIVIFQETLN